MKIVDLRISITDISDALSLSQNDIVAEIFRQAKAIVRQGGTITIEQRYQNAPPDIIAVYKTQQEVEDWKSKLNDVQSILKRDEIK